ncbi:MAG TPA: hypothetical protein VK007_03705 [Acidimicrobiales bacterium]|nr:hypothetical protein [Acidimicrobiales bacterium]
MSEARPSDDAGAAEPPPGATAGATPALPGSRWRRAPRRFAARGAANRVRRSHAQTRVTVRMALVFLLAAGAAVLAGEGTWLALHLLLAGGVVLAISGVSLMLAVTWSAAPAPADGWAWAQRLLVAAGAAGVAAGRHWDLGDAVVAGAGAAYAAGLATLAVLLVVTVRAGVERRFDAAVAAYVGAVAAGLGGVAVGVHLAVDGAVLGLRHAHVTLNLLGLVGLVVGGTLPYFAATVGRSRMAAHATPRRLVATDAVLAVGLVLAVAGFAWAHDGLATAGLLAYALGILAVASAMPRPSERTLRWAGPRLLGLWAGAAWWATAVVALALGAGDGPGVTMIGPWVTALVVAAYLQVLWGSLAYLLPMLRGGGHERLSAGFATTRSWLALVAANVAGVALVLDAEALVAGALAIWGLDTAVRTGLVLRRA